MLIFLDIDGVMVPAAGWKTPQFLEDGFPAFSLKATAVLQSLISADTTVMLTTSHKSKYTIGEWKDIFERRGIRIEKLKCLDSNDANLSRKDEVLRWFNANSIDGGFAIIDDDKSLNSLPPLLKEHLILTSSLVGLTKEHLKNIKAVLNKEPQFA